MDVSKMSFTRTQRSRARVLAVGAAVIIISGTWLGAVLKTEKQAEENIAKVRQASYEEQIDMLEAQKKSLYTQRDMIERKLSLFKERVKERDAKREK